MIAYLHTILLIMEPQSLGVYSATSRYTRWYAVTRESLACL